MSKHFWAVIVAIILVFVGVIMFSGDKSEAPGKTSSKGSQLTQHVIGQGTSGVTLLEYGDFQCSACESYEPIVEQVRAKYGDQLRFQFRHLPLTSLHPNAFAGARAAEAAGLQNKFWEMHDALYAPVNWQQWTTSGTPTDIFNRLAGKLGLNVEQFKKDYLSDQVNDAIQADLAEAKKLGLTATPSFFVNGKKVTINNSLDDFDKAIQAAMP